MTGEPQRSRYSAKERVRARRDAQSKAHLERRVSERTANLRIAKDRAECAERRKASFLANMSHELRTPLNCILGFADVLLAEAPGPLNRDQAVQLGLMRSSARHLLALVGDILDLSKIEAGQLELCCRAFDLCAALELVMAAVKPLADEKGLTLRLEAAHSTGALIGDRRRIEQILLNLLSNAIKFTEHGEVRLISDVVATPAASEWPTPQRFARLRVVDRGVGIRACDLDKLFQPFRQLGSGGGAGRNEGTGLGLAICRQLADLMGGEIEVQSEDQRGSVFTLMLPLDRAISAP